MSESTKFSLNEFQQLSAKLAQFEELAWIMIASGRKNNGYLCPQFVDELERLLNG